MKNTWENPELMKLGVESTERGPKPSIDRDEGIYDEDGNWWGGGKS